MAACSLRDEGAVKAAVVASRDKIDVMPKNFILIRIKCFDVEYEMGDCDG